MTNSAYPSDWSLLKSMCCQNSSKEWNTFLVTEMSAINLPHVNITSLAIGGFQKVKSMIWDVFRNCGINMNLY